MIASMPEAELRFAMRDIELTGDTPAKLQELLTQRVAAWLKDPPWKREEYPYLNPIDPAYIARLDGEPGDLVLPPVRRTEDESNPPYVGIYQQGADLFVETMKAAGVAARLAERGYVAPGRMWYAAPEFLNDILVFVGSAVAGGVVFDLIKAGIKHVLAARGIKRRDLPSTLINQRIGGVENGAMKGQWFFFEGRYSDFQRKEFEDWWRAQGWPVDGGDEE
jgi:hypothetical protein